MRTWSLFIRVPEIAIFSRPVVRKTQPKCEKSHRALSKALTDDGLDDGGSL